MSIFIRYENSLLGKADIQFSQCFIDNIEQGMCKISHSQTSNVVHGSRVVGSLEVLCRLSVKGESDSMSINGECRRDLESNIQKRDILFLTGNSQKCRTYCQCQPEASESNDRFQLDKERYNELNCRWHDNSRVITSDIFESSAVTPLKEFLQECTDVIDSINAMSSYQKAKKHRSCPDSRTEVLLPSPVARGRSHTPSAATGDWSKPPSWNHLTTNFVCPTIKPTRFCPNCLYNLSWLPKFAACPKCHVKIVPTYEEPVQNGEPTFEQIMKDYLGKQRPRNQEDKRCGEATGIQPMDTRCRCTSEKKLCAHCRIRKMCNDIYKPHEDRKVESQSDNSKIFLEAVNSRPHLTRVFSELRDLYRFKTRKEVPQSHTLCLQKKLRQNREMSDARPRTDRSTPKRSFQVSHTQCLQKKLSLNREMGEAEPNTDRSTAKRSFQAKPVKKQPKVGHKLCASRQRPVPRRHGWAWASSYEARNHGWRPGAILKPIRKLMNFFLYHLPAQIAQDVCQQELSPSQEPDSPPPTLRVSKKDGDIFITLHSLDGCSEQTVPVVFRVGKSDFAVMLSSLKKSLKARGFRKCTCHKTIMLCDCRPYWEKKRLENALIEECKYRGMESCVNDLVLTDTSDSEAEFDIDVTPPQPSTAQKPRTSNNGTQFNGHYRQPKSCPPIKQSPYWRAFDCAAGDRYRGTAFGKPGEAVFEDGIFGYGGGGPHGAAPLPANKPFNKAIWGGKRSGGPMRSPGRFGGGHPSTFAAELNAMKKQYAASRQPQSPRARRVNFCR